MKMGHQTDIEKRAAEQRWRRLLGGKKNGLEKTSKNFEDLARIQQCTLDAEFERAGEITVRE